ncbi:MAG: CDP-diacylglycerol--glycerol-3-phosphate 3-phosphatidyltransferase [Elusimicrobia bacterium]|nr:CDP-diacylglycerol--glycerol-3-phosphate 3-phosphatidyltransferase [Elusimicrobiota bacterium]
MTLANRITISRILMSMVIFIFLISKNFSLQIAAAALFAIAGFSDYIDGVIARRTKTTTPFGAIADPFADKMLIMAVFLAFASIRGLNVPLWAVFIILVRELTISTLRVLAALGGEVMKAEKSGKFKTFIQMFSAAVIMINMLLKTWIKTGPAPEGYLLQIVSRAGTVNYYLTIFAALITLISGAIYLYNHRELLEKSWGERKQ